MDNTLDGNKRERLDKAIRPVTGSGRSDDTGSLYSLKWKVHLGSKWRVVGGHWCNVRIARNRPTQEVLLEQI